MKALVNALSKLAEDVKSDCDSRLRYRNKYLKDRKTENRIPLMLMTNIGIQSLAAVRLMHFARDAGIPKGGEVLSRLIRYIYGMEIHWNAKIDPGVSIMHGVGLVISGAAQVGPGCILSQNVTLGEARDPQTKKSGAPTLGKNVHVGPGVTLLGPITIGEHSKIMAGSVVTQSVPPYTLVKPPQSEFEDRPRALTSDSDSTME